MTPTRTALRRAPALALVVALLLGAGGAAVWESGRAETVHGATAVGVEFGALGRDDATHRLDDAAPRRHIDRDADRKLVDIDDALAALDDGLTLWLVTEAGNGEAWFGGGLDLTPIYVDESRPAGFTRKSGRCATSSTPSPPRSGSSCAASWRVHGRPDVTPVSHPAITRVLW